MLAGAMLLGFSACMVTIPIFPEMLARIELGLPELKGEELNNVSAGYFNSCLGLGETLGPITASLLTASIGFRNSEDVLATLILIFCVCYFIYIQELNSVESIIQFLNSLTELLNVNIETEKKEVSKLEVDENPQEYLNQA
jgi:MFS family permease